MACLRATILALLMMLVFGGSFPPSHTQALSVAPTLTAPAEGTTLTSFTTTLTWTNPSGTTQYHLQVTPYKGEGPGVDLHIGSAGASFNIPAPPSWYGLLPDMTYTWRVRVSDAPTFVDLNHSSWGPWSERRFRTPAATSSSLTPLTPVQGDVARTLTPSLQWNSRGDLFYFEFQLSKDTSFNTDPATATAMVYSSLLHGGVTSPLNSYAVPATFPLEDNTTYYWRVRPRVQGDGKPLAWSPTYSFQTGTVSAPTLTAEPISFGLTEANATTCQIAGASRSFISTSTLTGVYYSFKYSGSGAVSLSWYRDNASLSASNVKLEASSACYKDDRGIPNGQPLVGLLITLPEKPGDYRLEVWHAGQKLQSSSYIVTPAIVLDIGPIFVGTGNVGCLLLGVSTSFPITTKTLFTRALVVGSGSVGALLFKGDVPLMEWTGQATGKESCLNVSWTPDGGFSPGTWRISYYIGTQAVQSTTFTIK